MSIGPILSGRLPQTLLASRLASNMQRANLALQRLQEQAATGQKFFLPSESPTEAIRAIALQTTIERKDQFQSNLQTDKSLLASTDSALAPVSDALIRAKALLLESVGDTVTPAEREANAEEVAGLIRSVMSSGNTKFRGRYLFGGSESLSQPFTQGASGIRYNGDRIAVTSFVDSDQTIANNIDGVAAFGALTEPIGRGVNPALTLDTHIADLFGGAGVEPGPIEVTLDNGGPVTQTVDLTNAETIGDVKTLIENAFGPGDVTVDIIAPPNSSGLSITPVAGTIAIADITGSTVARDLGIAQGPAASITSGDLDPRLTLQTPLSAFNNGLGATTADGLQITHGNTTKTIDISSAVTVEDLFNLIESENLDLELGINDAGDGLSISGRLSGKFLSIGENGGNDATSLGIRTLTADDLLSDLNFGVGVPVNELDENGNLLPAEITINRRDGSTTVVDLAGLTTVRDVLDAITAVDADLTATLNAFGNGISITDASGSGPLEVESSDVAEKLGIVGVEPGPNNAVPLVGSDVNQRQSTGVLSILVQLEQAIRAGDNQTLTRLDSMLNTEIDRFNGVRGEIGSRLKLLETVENRLLDDNVALKQSLSDEFDADLTEVVSQIASVMSVLQATLSIAASTYNLTLLSYL